MKKIFFIASAFVMGLQLLKAQTATNFNCNDCAGSNHNLFAELDAGKVIVISFVMPCASCIGPSLSAYNEVQNYASSNPGRVLFYCIDDVANTNCTTLTNWCNTNGMTNATVFSNSAVVESAYGSGGMPKILVIGGSSHTVFYNQNATINVAAFNTAINNALNTVGIKENSIDHFQLSLFPNPAKDKKMMVTYNLRSNQEITIDIYNIIGDKVKNVLKEQQVFGKHQQQIDLTNFSVGTYTIKVMAGDKVDVLKFVISE